MRLTYFGHSSFLVETADGTRVILDPYRHGAFNGAVGYAPIDEKAEVAPMLMIPLVENAFKHGDLIDGYLKIKINISVRGQKLDFTIRNSVLQEKAGETGVGIGLENFRKRLDINYKGNYSLHNEILENWYEARLIIPDLRKKKDEKNG